MTNNKKNKKNEKKEESNVVGNKFGDLTKEQMEEVQGQGDTNPETFGPIWDLINSTGQYKCR